jgi:uroporphyrin-III C-methyltransferase
MSAAPQTGWKAAAAERGLVTFVHADTRGVDGLSEAAMHALIDASVVLAGDEIDESLLRLVPVHARVVQLGRPGGRPAAPRSFINRLMLIAAREGERVVHLLTGSDGQQQLREAMPALRAEGVAIRLIELPVLAAELSGVTGGDAVPAARDPADSRALGG